MKNMVRALRHAEEIAMAMDDLLAEKSEEPSAGAAG
jgi:hypothetical protein